MELSVLSDEQSPEIRRFRAEVIQGLSQPHKALPCKYFYDERGSQLFDRICELDEYYLTRTEIEIMRAHVGEMAERIGSGSILIEYGSGSSMKTRYLLDHLHELRAYVPIDISREHLYRSVERLEAAYPGLPIRPVCADYTSDLLLPIPKDHPSRRVVYFPGSTLGNFEPGEALRFLQRVARVCGEGGGLLIGVDLEKDESVLEPAYNDREGVTAAFNLNLLHRMNRELGADFDVEGFRHRAIYNRPEGRIEMHLQSLQKQSVRIGNVTIQFAEGERLCTEYSYKYTPVRFAQLADEAGFAVEQVWTDPRRWFSVQLLHRTSK
ncbi:MAG: L-histidine N(alpha)-methyltransferase [Armatimonadetes bacterium]|nr:L-histidine N(alpha)-methyltransferase [Armatimonadota bacterium]